MTKEELKQLEKQRNELDAQIKKYYREKQQAEILTHKDFVGKTYKKVYNNECTKYYKILSLDDNNQYRANTLVFTLPVLSNSIAETEDECFLTIESIGWWCNQKFKAEEISQNEYNEALEEFWKEFKEVIQCD